MMRVNLLIIIFLICFFRLSAQSTDKIYLNVKLDTVNQTLAVNQEFFLTNHTQRTLNEIHFHSWIGAYTGRHTELNRIKLENRKDVLHFSNRADRGRLENLMILNENDIPVQHEIREREFIRVSLDRNWNPGETIKFSANYFIKIPTDRITGYGFNSNGDYLMRYFFLQPATVDDKGQWYLQHYKDFEGLMTYPTDFVLKFDHPEGYEMFSDLYQDGNLLKGENMEPFRVYLTKNPSQSHSFFDSLSETKVDFGFNLNEEDAAIVDSLLSSQLQFLEKHLGKLPSKNIFISSKTRKEQDFFGADDLDIWIKKLKLFSQSEKNALKLFQGLSYEYTDRLLLTDKQKDHWIKNGLQFYLMMKYVNEKFPDLKLLGRLPGSFSLLGVKPLNYFHASHLKLNDRYKLLYLYLARQNYDQPINTPYDELSKMNQTAMSGFKTGLTFYYIDSFLDGEVFSRMMKDFVKEYSGWNVDQYDFERFLRAHSPKDLSWFFDDYINEKDKINFTLSKIEEGEDRLNIKIKNDTDFQGPFMISASKDGVPVESRWYDRSGKKSTVYFPKGDYDKVELNPGYLFPEFNDRDNYIHTGGIFKNTKKLQFKLFTDIENPEYSQIFMYPSLQWNNYDKFLLGIQFHNQSLLTKPFKWQITPKYSTGTGNLAGSTAVQNTFTPRNSIFRAISIGAGGKFEHYNKNLSYLKWSVFGIGEFAKNPRETLSQGVILSYDNLNKEVPSGFVKTDKDKYSLWRAVYYYSRPDYIHETHGSVSFQAAQSFQKIFGEFYYRWRFSRRQQLGVRLYAATFIENRTDTDYFNFGVSRVSDYAFNINLLGRSETSGILSQQYVLAEAGFKSDFNFTVDRWLIATNVEIPIWKMFDVYADAAVYKNNDFSPKFIYDSGVKIKVIPDFLEFYFPIQSSLGFEPSMDNYWERLRFTLSFRVDKIVSHLRRGWY